MEAEMNFVEFTEKMREEVSKKSGREFELTTVVKNNSAVYVSMITVEKSHIVPTIYLEPFYNKYCSGWRVNQLARDFITMYNEAESQDIVGLEIIDQISKYEVVKKEIYFKLINYENNVGLLKDVPHDKFMNLAKVFYIRVKSTNGLEGSITIKNEMLKSWSISKTELARVAEENTLNSKPVIKKMTEILDRIYDKEELDEIENAEEKMYVMTNAEQHFGAATMCNMSVLKGFADKVGTDLCILPSSLHEVILTPIFYSNVVEMYEKIFTNKVRVCSVNSEAVERTEILSNNVYLYRRETSKIEMY